jgi:hypothetical protein
MDFLKLVSTGATSYRVHYRSNDVELGSIYREIGGEWVFYPVPGGIWESHVLRAIADEIDKREEAWRSGN